MAAPSLVANALAEAFLAGAWEEEALLSRGYRVLDQRPRWLRRLVLQALKRFETAPPDATVLADALFEAEALRRAARDLTIRRWIMAEPGMTPAPRTAGFGVHPLRTAGDVASWLGLSAGELAWFADMRGLERRGAAGALRHYRYRWLRKSSGGWRLVEAPRARLKAMQRRILDAVLDPAPPHEAAHGFRRGRSVLSYVAPHVGQRILLRLDLRDFFASVRASRVHALFRTLGYPREVARILTGLCTNAVPHDAWAHAPAADTPAEAAERWRARRFYGAPHLPAGAPTSPALANLAAFRLDMRLCAASRRAGAEYTRYADDLAFSGGNELARSAFAFRDLCVEIIAEEGFTVNARKTRAVRRGARQRLAGLTINARPNVGRVEYERLKAVLHNCVRHGPASQNRAQHRSFRAFLEGRVAWVAHVHPKRGEKLSAKLQQIDWSR